MGGLSVRQWLFSKPPGEARMRTEVRFLPIGVSGRTCKSADRPAGCLKAISKRPARAPSLRKVRTHGNTRPIGPSNSFFKESPAAWSAGSRAWAGNTLFRRPKPPFKGVFDFLEDFQKVAMPRRRSRPVSGHMVGPFRPVNPDVADF